MQLQTPLGLRAHRCNLKTFGLFRIPPLSLSLTEPLRDVSSFPVYFFNIFRNSQNLPRRLATNWPQAYLEPNADFRRIPKMLSYLAVPLCWQSYVIAFEELPVCTVKVWQDHLEESCSHESLLADRFRKKKICVDRFPVSLFRPIPPWSPSLIWPAAAFLIHIRGIMAWVSISLLKCSFWSTALEKNEGKCQNWNWNHLILPKVFTLSWGGFWLTRKRVDGKLGDGNIFAK